MTLSKAIVISDAATLCTSQNGVLAYSYTIAELQEASNTLSDAGYRSLANRCDDGIRYRVELQVQYAEKIRNNETACIRRKQAINRGYIA